MISATAIIRGVGITFDMPILEVKGATGYFDSDLQAKAIRAAEAFDSGDYDFGFVHVKATDDAGHEGDIDEKIRQLEKAD